MKKYVLILSILISSSSFAQNIISKIENASAAQYELLKKTNEYYPDINLSDKVINFYVDNKVIDTKQEFVLKNTNFSSYNISLNPDNKKIMFEFTSSDNGKIYGEVNVFNGNYVRTTFNEKLGQFDVMVNGKAVYTQKL